MMTVKFALRNIFRHQARSIITISTIVFGCVALIFVGGFFDDIFFNMREGYIGAHTGHLQIYRKGFNKHGRMEPFNYMIEDPQAITSLVGAIPQVRYITSRLQFSGLISTGENTISFIGQGIDSRFEKGMSVAEIEKLVKMPNFKNDHARMIIETGEDLLPADKYQAILGKGLAADIGVQTGGNVTLLTNTVQGGTNALDMNVKGTFFTAAKSFDDIFLRIPLSIAQKLLNTKSVQSMIVSLNKTEDTKMVRDRLVQIFQEKKMDLEIKTWEELVDFYAKTVKMFNQFQMVMQLVTAIVVVLGIFNTMNMAVMERISEIGTMMALGTKRRGVMKLFLYEGIGLGVIGGTIGVLTGIIFVKIVAFIGITMPPPPGMTVSWMCRPTIVPSSLTVTFILSVLIGGVSALYPAFKASRLQIAEALRYR